MADHRDSRTGLTRRVFAGVGWLLAQSTGTRLMLFAAQIALAKILLPSDFASFALAVTVTALFEALINFGVDDVLLQRQRTMHLWATPAFVTSVGLSIVGMLLVITCMPAAVLMYDAPVLYSILPIMAVGMPLNSLSIVPAATIRAALNFRFLAIYATVELAATQIASIVLALNGFGVLSFVLPGPVLAVVRAAVFWIIARPHLGPLRIRQLRMLGKSSSAVFGSRVVTAILGQADYFVLGLFASKPEVGAYFVAFRLAVQPVRMLAGSLYTVIFPVLATLRSEPVRQREAALDACRVLAFITMPLCFMQAAVMRPLFGLLFGSKWDAAIVPAEILSIALGFDAVSWIAAALLSARGEFRRLFILTCMFLPVFFLFIVIGAHVGAATGVAIAVSLFYATFSPCFSFAVFRRAGASMRDVAMIYLNSTAIAAAAIGAAVALMRVVPTGSLGQIGVVVMFGGGLYLLVLRLVAPLTYNQIKDRIRGTLLTKRPSEKLATDR